MWKIALIRPGRTEYDEQDRLQGTLEIPLCEAGHGDALQLIAALGQERFDAIYAANCLAAWETAAAIASHFGQRCKRLDRLSNADLGLWQGMRREDLRQKHPKVFRQWAEQPDSVCPPEGELLSVVRQRCAQTAQWLRRKHRRGHVALVAGAPLWELLRSELLGQPPRDPWSAGDGFGSCRWIEPVPLAAELAKK